MEVTIIIPAYNEESTIDRCLRNLLEGPEEKNLNIVVVCNGCTDATAEHARAYEPKVKVIETSIGSKTFALNMGDSIVTSFPRFYIDADIIINQHAVWEVAKVIFEGNALAAAPKLKIDYNRASNLVKAYFRVWSKLPYATQGMIGSGVYAVSAIGRSRFCEFPDVFADDAFVRLLFNTNERLTVDTVEFTITAPINLYWLIAIKTRAYLGSIELKHQYPDLFIKKENENLKALLKNIVKLQQLSDIIVYMLIKMCIRINARRRLLIGSWRHWDQDPTSRKAG